MGAMTWEFCKQLLKLNASLCELFYESEQNGCQSTYWVRESGTTWMPSIEVEETEEAFFLSAHLPNLLPGSLAIHTTEETISLEGYCYKSSQPKSYFEFEFTGGQFRSLIPLAGKIYPQEAIAHFENDCLTLVLPRHSGSSNWVNIPVNCDRQLPNFTTPLRSLVL